jgi:hypothetical protein
MNEESDPDLLMMDIKNTKITVRERWPEIFSARAPDWQNEKNHHDSDWSEHTTFPTIIITTESNHGSD